MRIVLAALLLIASSGVIFAGSKADNSLLGIASNFQVDVLETCEEQAVQGDRLLGYLSSSDSIAVGIAHDPDRSTVSLLRYLACGFLD